MANIIDRTTIDSAVSGTQLITKTWLGNIITDIEKGWWRTDIADTYIFARFFGPAPPYAGLYMSENGLNSGQYGTRTNYDGFISGHSNGGIQIGKGSGTGDGYLRCGQTDMYGYADIYRSDTSTASIAYPLILHHVLTSGTAAAGCGTGMYYYIENDNGDSQPAAQVYAEWTTETDGSESADYVVGLINNGSFAEAFRVTSNGSAQIQGAINHDGNTIGFFGTSPASQAAAYTPTNVTTDRSFDADTVGNAEMADVLGTLIADLQAYGLLQ